MKLRTQIPKTLIFIAVGMALASGAMAKDRQVAIPSSAHGAPHAVQLADRDDHHHQHFPIVVHPVDHRGAAWGHGDIHRFHDFDFDDWHRGHWSHDWHDNHFGWWWVVGGAWVFFNAPVYPYPDPYVPSTVIVQQAPPPDAPPAGAPAPAYWYYCASAQNYYPYVTQCPMGWEQVPATPAAPVTAPPPPQIGRAHV